MAIDVLDQAALEALILPEGQMGYDMRANVLKVGDSVKTWPELKGTPMDAVLNVTVGGGLEFPPNDGVTYAARNSQWVPIDADVHYTASVLPPALEAVNKTGEMCLELTFPWKYADRASIDFIAEKLRQTWTFPFAEGRLTKIAVRANVPNNTTINARVNGQMVFTGAKSITAEWTEYETLSPVINYGQAVEISVSQGILAEDLQVRLFFTVGNAAHVYIPGDYVDAEPKVYAFGAQKSAWGASGEDSPDGAAKSVYIPSVTKLISLPSGWAAKGAEEGKWYICGTYPMLLNAYGVNSNVTTPIEIPIDGIEDIGAYWVKQNNDVYPCIIYRLQDGSVMRSWASSTSNNYNASTTVAQSIPDGQTPKYFSELGLTGSATVFIGSQENKLLAFYFTGNPSNGNSAYTQAHVHDLPEGEEIKKIAGTFVLSKSGKLYNANINLNKITLTELPAPEGVTLTNVWAHETAVNTCFALSSTGGLYAYGAGNYGMLGLPSATYSELTKVGDFDVKKINTWEYFTLMLLNDGRLMCTGRNDRSNLLPYYNQTLEGFVEIYPNYRFTDIAFSTQGSFAAIAEYLGEISSN